MDELTMINHDSDITNKDDEYEKSMQRIYSPDNYVRNKNIFMCVMNNMDVGLDACVTNTEVIVIERFVKYNNTLIMKDIELIERIKESLKNEPMFHHMISIGQYTGHKGPTKGKYYNILRNIINKLGEKND